MMLERTVFARTTFEAVHEWKVAPEDVAYLRFPHRHRFGVEVEVGVRHDDRDVEFIMLQHKIDRLIEATPERHACSQWSCERWAEHIGDQLRAMGLPVRRVEVSEDGENGATVRWLV